MQSDDRKKRWFWSGCLVAIVFACGSPASAQATGETLYDLPAQSLGKTLSSLGRQSGVSIIAEARVVDGLRAPALRGNYSLDQALQMLLEGTGLTVERIGESYVIKRLGRSAADSNDADSDIVVTGSRIRGAPVPSTTIRIDAEVARSSGQATVTDIIRTIPQNFGGGQNPGVGLNVPEAIGSDVGGGSSLNLRGLGSDATLTLLNGHRLPYSAAFQSIDVSAIPLDAIDRIEVVADGASAIYGSDAVAGVANVILKRDYDGLRTSARIGGSTDGGDETQQYDVVGGKAWGSGGLLVSYQFSRSTRIRSSQRDYAAAVSPGVTMYPFLKRHSVVVTGHQELAPGIVFSLDGLFGLRWKESEVPSNAAGDLSVSRQETNTHSRTFALAPNLKADLGSGWRADLSGLYGKDRTIFVPDKYRGTTLIPGGHNCYCNEGLGIEAGADGPLFALPGGPAQLAIGLGWRENKLRRIAPLNAVSNFDASQSSRFAYGEINLPFVSHDQKIGGIDSLSMSAAVRYERYPGIGSVATPKLGIVYAPVEGFTLKASWGKSFRAPTLFQQYFFNQAITGPPAIFGGTGYPAGSTALYFIGGSASLKPERATSWSATAVIEPRPIPSLHLEVGVFHTRYTDRIITPVPTIGTELSNPAYADLLTRNPTLAQVNAVLNSAAVVGSLTGGAVDPTRVAVIIDNRYVNAAAQTIKGVDMLASYHWDLGGSALDLSANASLIDSSQIRLPGQASTDLAGVIFNPPHFRARGSANWSNGPINLSLAANRIGGVSDTRFSPAIAVRGMTTFDAAIRFRPIDGLLKGFDFLLAADNLFDRAPGPIRKQVYYDTPYDSTNYSAIGRFVSLTIARSW